MCTSFRELCIAEVSALGKMRPEEFNRSAKLSVRKIRISSKRPTPIYVFTEHGIAMELYIGEIGIANKQAVSTPPFPKAGTLVEISLFKDCFGIEYCSDEICAF